MKKFTHTAFILMSILLFQAACTSTSDNKKMYSSVLGNNNTKAQLAETDVRLLVNIYASGLFKISLANEAKIRSISPEAIQLANTVSGFYEGLNAQVASIAESHGVTLPMDLSNDQKEAWKELVKETGWAFDEKFLQMSETFFKEDVQVLTIASQNSSDKNISALSAKATSDIMLHKTLIEILDEKIKERTAIIAAKDTEKEKGKAKKPGSKTKSTLTK